MPMKRRVILDIEADGLLDTVSRIWCIVAKDIDTGEVFLFHPKVSSPCTACKTTGTVTKTDGDYLCEACCGTGITYSGDHNEWIDDFKEFFKQCGTFIGHNLIGYDNIVIKRILGLDIKLSTTIDTLVLSKLFRPSSPFVNVGNDDPSKPDYVDNRLGGHGLSPWGKRLGFPKQDFDDFTKYSDIMLGYCVNDVELNHRIWEILQAEQSGINYPCPVTGLPVPFSETSIRLEHKMADLFSTMELDGFYMDRDAIEDMRVLTEKHVHEMKTELQKHFPPVRKFIKEWAPKYNQDGTMNRMSQRMIENWDHDYDEDTDTYKLYDSQEFNPQSGDQVAKRLLELGWEPTKFTPTGKPATGKDIISEVLDTMVADHPHLEALRGYRVSTFCNNRADKWLELSEKTGRMHGRCNHIGAPTHRCAHSDDNMASVSKVKFEKDGVTPIKGKAGNYGWDSRRCCSVPVGKVLVGADASGIQLRALAHYMNSTIYTQALLKSDIHTVHQQAAGLSSRDEAKTFIYSWLFGSGDEKIGQLLGIKDVAEQDDLIKWAMGQRPPWGRAKNLLEHVMASIRKKGRKASKILTATTIKGYRAKRQFLDRTPALKRLKTEDIPKAVKKGYMIGLDGRKMWIPNEHLAMTLYLQGFEAVIMKTAIALFHRDLRRRGIPFKMVAFVHDEVQIETIHEYAHAVGKAVVAAIKKAGEMYNVNCPLDGEYKIGANWAQTH